MTKERKGLSIVTGPLPEGRCLAGFSGGADSTALMLLLAAERDKGHVFPEAVHVNHGLRGEESDEDEAFCRNVCDTLEIPLHVLRIDLGGKKDENSCREERFRCFRTVMEETGIRHLILAHNREDLAETFLMRLIRGTGPEGLACMSGKDEREGYSIWRPLLAVGRDEIRSELSKCGCRWREDSLNEADSYLRNRIRRRLLPLMEEMGGDVSRKIAHTAAIITEENRMLNEKVLSFLTNHSGEGWLDCEALNHVPRAMRNRILRAWWKRYARLPEEHALSAAKTAELAALSESVKGKINLPGGIYAVKCRHGLYITGTAGRTDAEIPITLQVPGEVNLGEISLTFEDSKGNPGNGITEQEVPEEMLHGCILRTRRNGDRIRPFGMNGSKKLQDYFVDRKVDEPVRSRIPLICRGSEVLMAAGVGTGNIPEWKRENRNIRIVWKGKMPWRPEERLCRTNESEF